MQADGLEPVKLSGPWLDHAEGDEVRVDPDRAAWLRANGFAKPEPAEKPNRKRRPAGKE